MCDWKGRHLGFQDLSKTEGVFASLKLLLDQDTYATAPSQGKNVDLMDETFKFEASIKGVKDPAEREMRQRDFQSWLRDRQAEFNTRNASKG